MGCPQVCAGATLQCSFGAAPTVLNVLPQNRTLTSGMPAANIMDHIPLLNIPTFGLCQSPANPALDANGTLICTWGGVIKISVPGQVQMLIP
ncbi:hypothetical protein IPC85_17360 [Pseudomonas aeruginosa]|uniref:DUF4280 domain-containing protein n=1 Tax=Pseudomonas aeruginosa TaxID=287 RepID=UPI000EFF06CD|nr:DUF4280 domain-containing protein [Pseudomonas aeruginosa]RMK76198.1 hypothetical protein IPC84_28545 [Pseudomonas aeruginosa]RMK77347.1 hypothetical protein IPC85_17360 [Pseudomonas aeruginosa]